MAREHNNREMHAKTNLIKSLSSKHAYLVSKNSTS